jgi:hypothetical protein
VIDAAAFLTACRSGCDFFSFFFFLFFLFSSFALTEQTSQRVPTSRWMLPGR